MSVFKDVMRDYEHASLVIWVHLGLCLNFIHSHLCKRDIWHELTVRPDTGTVKSDRPVHFNDWWKFSVPLDYHYCRP